MCRSRGANGALAPFPFSHHLLQILTGPFLSLACRLGGVAIPFAGASHSNPVDDDPYRASDSEQNLSDDEDTEVDSPMRIEPPTKRVKQRKVPDLAKVPFHRTEPVGAPAVQAQESEERGASAIATADFVPPSAAPSTSAYSQAAPSAAAALDAHSSAFPSAEPHTAAAAAPLTPAAAPHTAAAAALSAPAYAPPKAAPHTAATAATATHAATAAAAAHVTAALPRTTAAAAVHLTAAARHTAAATANPVAAARHTAAAAAYPAAAARHTAASSAAPSAALEMRIAARRVPSSDGDAVTSTAAAPPAVALRAAAATAAAPTHVVSASVTAASAPAASAFAYLAQAKNLLLNLMAGGKIAEPTLPPDNSNATVSGATTPLKMMASAAHPLSAEFISEAYDLLAKIAEASFASADQLRTYFGKYLHHKFEEAIATHMMRALAVNYKYNVFAVRESPLFAVLRPLLAAYFWF